MGTFLFKKQVTISICAGYFTVFTCFSVRAGETDYASVFGKNWQKAVAYIDDNKEWMQRICAQNGVDYPFVSAVVFPELIRYSALRDQMEITLLKALYVHFGSEYSNFSVGVFQVKPSCAEEILRYGTKSGGSDLFCHFRDSVINLPVREKRKAIVCELEKPAGEFSFVVTLVRILEKKYNRKKWNTPEEKLRFFSAAFNAGFNFPEKYIRKMMTVNEFHIRLVRPEVTYCYPDISWAIYRSLRE